MTSRAWLATATGAGMNLKGVIEMAETDREDIETDTTNDDVRESPLTDAELGEVAGGSHPLGPFGRRWSGASVEQIERFIP